MAITVTRTPPPAVISGFSAVADYGFEKCYNTESGVLVDRTLEFQDGASPVESFSLVDDYIYLGYKPDKTTESSSGTDGRFISIYINLDTLASTSISPVFEYNSGNNTWATLVVTDGTNGFTQNGEISVVLASLPSYSVWVKGSQNGSGVEIGDAIDRCYIRIKRTAVSLVTPPKIKEAGTGELSANTTYYYRANSILAAPVYSDYALSNSLKSIPCSEISTTTTSYKRSIRLFWTLDNLHHMIWRTPISGNYTNAGSSISYSSDIDVESQQVRGKSFWHPSSNLITDTYIIDNGLPVVFARNGSSTTVVFSNYVSRVFSEYERGQISLSGGTSVNPSKWIDVYNASVAGSWNSFVALTPSDSTAKFHSWDCRDNIIIDGYITDNTFQITLRGNLSTYAATTFMTFGTNTSFTNVLGTTSYYYRNGGIFNFANGISTNYNNTFSNCKMYDCRIEQAGLDADGRQYTFFIFQGDNNQFYKCIFNSESIFEGVTFSGTGLILDDVTLNGLRYGLDISSSSFATATFNNLTLTGNVGIKSDTIPNGGNVIFNGFSFKYMSGRLNSCYLAVGTKDKIVNEYFVNPILDVGINGTFQKSWGGINYTLYEQYTLDLKIQNKNGIAIDGCSVKIYDNSEVELFNKITDVNGLITKSALTYAKYNAGTPYLSGQYYTYYMDIVTTYPIYTVVISKAGYKTKTIRYTMNKKREETEILEEIYTTDSTRIRIG